MHIQRDCSTQTDSTSMEPSKETYLDETPKTTHLRKPQLLIIGDSVVRGCGMLFKTVTGSYFDVNVQYQQTTTLNDIEEKLKNYVGRLTKNDYVLISTSPGDIVGGDLIEECRIKDLLIRTKNTNLVLLGSPYMHHDRISLNKLIALQNIKVAQTIQGFGTGMFVDPNDFEINYSDKNYSTRYQKKERLVHFIKNLLVPFQGTEELIVKQHKNFLKRLETLKAPGTINKTKDQLSKHDIMKHKKINTNNQQKTTKNGKTVLNTSTDPTNPSIVLTTTTTNHNVFFRGRCYTTRD